MTTRPRFDMADLVRRHRAELEIGHRLSIQQRRVLTAMTLCRTAALGGHVEVCEHGDYERISYNSCRNRHCPKCQALAQEKWIVGRSEAILPIPHFHVVFTLPSELRPLARRHPVEVYDALFKAASETLLELGRTHLGATPGITMVLHTWTRELRFHPHVHALMTAGGLALDGGTFVHVEKPFLFPVKVMGALLKGKLMDRLRHLQVKGSFPELGRGAFGALMARLADLDWVVYAKAPFKRSQHVLQYLGRYTHRVGMANSRLVDVGEHHVTFRTKHGKTATLHPVAFLYRFLQHILPPGFHKIRHAGLYAATRNLETARTRLEAETPVTKRKKPKPLPTWEERRREILGHDHERCPRCGGRLQRYSIPRAPPLSRAS